MMYGAKHWARLTCQFTVFDQKDPTLDQLEILADTHTCKFTFSWSWAAPSVVRDDLLVLVTNLAKRCVGEPGQTGDMSAPNFFARLPHLQFENLRGQHHSDGTIELELRVGFNETADFLQKPVVEKTGSTIEDVFLPLTNLSAYLHAMEDQTGSDGPGQAVSQTADRIDEFLLIYGNRLQDAGENTGFRLP